MILPSFVLVGVEIAILAHALGVNETVGMLALGGQLGAPVHVVAMVAHSSGVMLAVDVGAPGDCLPVPYRFGRRSCVVLPKRQVFLQLTEVVFQIFGGLDYLKNGFYLWYLLGDRLVLEVNGDYVADLGYPFYVGEIQVHDVLPRL